MSSEYTAIEIDSPKVAELAVAIDPTLMELEYERDLHGNFLVIGFPVPGTCTVVPPITFYDNFHRIETGTVIQLRLFEKQ